MYQQSAEKFILWNKIKLYNKQQRDVMENIYRLYCDIATLVDQKITGNRSDILVENKTTMCDICKSVDFNLEFECDEKCYTDTTTKTA